MIVINPDHQDLRSFIENIEVHFQQSTDVLYDQRNQIRVVQFNKQNFVVKSFKVPNFINRFAYRFLRPSKAKRSYEYSLKIGKDYCPEAIAYTEEYKNTLLEKSYYISRLYDYDFTIRPVLLDKSFDKTIQKQVLKELAYFSYTLHKNNILHHDFSYGNILIKKASKAELGEAQYQFNIIDVNRMQFKNLTLDDRLNNFARLQADDDAMQIIISRYAQLVKTPVDDLLPRAKHFRDEFIRKREFKNKLRGR